MLVSILVIFWKVEEMRIKLLKLLLGKTVKYQKKNNFPGFCKKFKKNKIWYSLKVLLSLRNKKKIKRFDF